MSKALKNKAPIIKSPYKESKKGSFPNSVNGSVARTKGRALLPAPWLQVEQLGSFNHRLKGLEFKVLGFRALGFPRASRVYVGFDRGLGQV